MTARLAAVLALATLTTLAAPRSAASDPPKGSTLWEDVRRAKGPLARALRERAALRLFASHEASSSLRAELVRLAVVELNRAHLLAPHDPEIAFSRAKATAAQALLPTTSMPGAVARLALSRFTELRASAPQHREESVAFEMAILHTKLGEYPRAAEEYRRARRALLDPRFGATITMNLAEVTMLSGDLEGAVGYFEEAIGLGERLSANGGHQLTLALVGGAVAYDRLGDGARALDLMKRARALEGGAVRATRAGGVFYEPEEEIHYYDALDALAWAAEASGDERARALRAAESSIVRFLELGEATSLFAARARARLAEVRALLAASP